MGNLATAIVNVQREFGVTPSQAKLLILLAAKESVTAEAVADIGIIMPARIAVHKLRKRVSPTLEIGNRMGVGWYVTAEVRAKIAEAAKRDATFADQELGQLVQEASNG